MKHAYIEHKKCARPYCNICEGGLSICTVCGLSEGALTDDCPGVHVPYSTMRASYAGRLNFRDGMWREEPNTLGWADARLQSNGPLRNQINAQEIATNLTDEALADLLHDLGDILHARLRDKSRVGSWLKRQLDAACIEVRSWPSSRQQQIKDRINHGPQ